MDKLLQAIADNIIIVASLMVPISIVAVTSFFAHKRMEMAHRERLAAIEKGITPPGPLADPEKNGQELPEQAKVPPNYLRRGLFWFCPGAGLVAFSLIALVDVIPAIRLPIMGVSVVCAGIGAAYLVIHVIESDRMRPGLQ